MQPRRSSYGDDEDIVVKPSTELIADEYEHSLKSTKNIEVHTFAADYIHDQENAGLFIETLNKNSYEIKSGHNHCLDNGDFSKVLREIQHFSNEKASPDGLILYFSGFCRGLGNQTPREGAIDIFDGETNILRTVNIQDIWSMFTSDKCPELKNKPKIFIFHITVVTKVETDSRRHMFTTYNVAYETPTEADILIVYHKSDKNYQMEFTEQLCDNITRYGKNEDIISLVTCIDSSVFDTRPIIISTLTRKFYFTASDYRGLHLDIDESHKQVKKDLAELKDKLCQVNTKKEKKSIFSFSMGKKRPEHISGQESSSEVDANKSNDGIRKNAGSRNSNKNVMNGKVTPNPNAHIRISKSESEGGRPRWSFALPKY